MRWAVADRLPLTLWLAVVWVLLWGSLSWLVVLSAALVAPLCLLACRLPARSMATRPRTHLLAATTARFGWDLLTSSAAVAWASIRRGPRTRSAIVAIPVACTSDIALTVVANRLTLEPGTLVVDIDRPSDTVYLYVLDVQNADDIERACADARLRIDTILRALGEERP
ncbi:MAG TPA: Na+/H+ antiporter subunit E [Nocardioidaceae bacterium]|nr:Na+/H+ antiporter subunit E [Nocardioidaceae bacterium]